MFLNCLNISLHANFLAEKSASIFWDMMPWNAVEVHRHFEGKQCLQLEGQEATSKKKTARCLLLDHCLACSSWRPSVTFKKMVTATRNPASWFPLLGKKILMESQGLLMIFVSFFTSTINRVLLGTVFLGDDNIQSFIIKQMRSVNLKVVISKFKITFHIFWELIGTRKTFLFNFIWA
jgi:hypothetical protein